MFATVSRRLAVLIAALSLSAAGLPAAAETLVVYSARNEQLIKPVFDAYTRETGVQVKFTTGDAAVLIERLAALTFRHRTGRLLNLRKRPFVGPERDGCCGSFFDGRVNVADRP